MLFQVLAGLTEGGGERIHAPLLGHFPELAYTKCYISVVLLTQSFQICGQGYQGDPNVNTSCIHDNLNNTENISELKLPSLKVRMIILPPSLEGADE